MPTFYLVDLPGYGYAKASKGERAGFKLLLEAYLTGRPNLAGVVWLLDIRHEPSDQDYEVQDALILTERPVLVVLTKGDKLPRGQRAAAYASRARDLGLSPTSSSSPAPPAVRGSPNWPRASWPQRPEAITLSFTNE